MVELHIRTLRRIPTPLKLKRIAGEFGKMC
jgi:hypothetical protein